MLMVNHFTQRTPPVGQKVAIIVAIMDATTSIHTNQRVSVQTVTNVSVKESIHATHAHQIRIVSKALNANNAQKIHLVLQLEMLLQRNVLPAEVT